MADPMPTFNGAIMTELRPDGSRVLCDDSAYPARFRNRWATLKPIEQERDNLRTVGYFPYPKREPVAWFIGLAETPEDAAALAGNDEENRCPTCGRC